MQTENLLRVGYARTDITPDEALPLGGHGNALKRVATGTRDPLLATCVAFSDEKDETILVYSLDLLYYPDEYLAMLRQRVSKDTGIAEDHVMLCATHTHSGPALGAHITIETPWAKKLSDMVSKAATDALADRKPARFFAAGGEVPAMNFVRHYKQEGGLYCGANFGFYTEAKIIAHTGQPDWKYKLVKCVREGGKDILMLNWQVHPCLTMYGREYSADYVAVLRDMIEEKTGANFVFYQGAAGNLSTVTRIPEEEVTQDMEEYGCAVVGYVLPALERMEPLAGGEIRVSSALVEHPVNHTEDHKKDAAFEVRAFFEETNDLTATKHFARERGMNSIYHANAVIRKSEMGEMRTIPIQAAVAGDLAFAFAPYEMFSGNGVELKENSPFPVTFVSTLSNGYYGYLPTRDAFGYNCYEANTTPFAPGIGEKLSETFVKLMQDMKK